MQNPPIYRFITDEKNFVSCLNELKAIFFKDGKIHSQPMSESDIRICNEMFSMLKMYLFTTFVLNPPFHDIIIAKQQLLLSRETLELATFFSAHVGDLKGFKRNISQLKTYYSDYTSILERSVHQKLILGMNLLSLLAEGLLVEFHMELESISFSDQEHKYIQYSIQMEQWLMEGKYNKVLHSSNEIPHPLYKFFVNILANTVRDKITDSCSVVYDKLSLSDAFQISTIDITVPFMKTNNSLEFTNLELMKHMLSYNNELEVAS